MEYFTREINDKKVVWLKKTNQYLQLELPAFEVFASTIKGDDKKKIVSRFLEKYQLPEPESEKFISGIQSIVQNLLNKRTERIIETYPNPALQKKGYYSERYYHFSGCNFCFFYETQRVEIMTHPQIAHIEVEKTLDRNNTFQLLDQKNSFILFVNNRFIGKWNNDNSHYFIGKISMEFLNLAYKKTEADWMAVLHASAISNGKNCILFPAESGSGKSTLSAILYSKGLKVLSDDFVPIEASTGQVFQFPSAISIKKGAMSLLSPVFPVLLSADEYIYKEKNKTVRYLSHYNNDTGNHAPVAVKAIVFVKYEKDVLFSFKEIDKNIAFKRLIPDSWTSPQQSNAEKFMDWFIEMPCYQLTYSNNNKMATSLINFFQNGQ
jgi:hypothetical protein